jgi:hypothetical protein
MFPSDAAETLQVVMSRWSRPVFEPGEQQRYLDDLLPLDAAEARTAIDLIHASGGQRFRPQVGDIINSIARAQLDAPDWPEVRRQLNERSAEVERRREESFEWTCPEAACDGSGWILVVEEVEVLGTKAHVRNGARCACYEARKTATQVSDNLHPLVREWIREGYITWPEVEDLTDVERRDRATLEAQARDKWGAFTSRAIRARAMAVAGIKAPASMRAITEGRREDSRRGALGKPDLVAALTRGED